MSKVRAAVYTRISQDRAGQAAGVKRQEADCRKLVKDRGWSVEAVLTDNDISASKGRRRPAYEELLEGIRSGRFDAVVVYKTDRLHRRVRDLEDFIDAVEKHRVKVATVAGDDIRLDTVNGRAMARMAVTMARAEAENMGERIARKHEERAEQGLPHPGGKRAFGYDYVPEARTYRVVSEEAALIRRMARDIQRGRSLSDICAELNAKGVRTIRDGKWWLSNLKGLLLSPVIAGRRVHGRTGTDVRGNWEPIIEPEEQERLRAILEDPARKKSKGGRPARAHLLSGLMSCAYCGAKLYASHGGYVCSRTTSGLGCVRIQEKMADEIVYQEVAHTYLARPAASEKPPTTEEEDQLIAERLSLLARRDALAEKLADGLLDDRGYTVGTRRLDKRVKAIEGSLSELLRSQVTEPDPEAIGGLFAGVGPWAKAAYELTEPELLQRREYIKAMVERIEVTKASARGKVEPSRIRITYKEQPAPKLRAKKAVGA